MCIPERDETSAPEDTGRLPDLENGAGGRANSRERAGRGKVLDPVVSRAEGRRPFDDLGIGPVVGPFRGSVGDALQPLQMVGAGASGRNEGCVRERRRWAA